MSVLDWLPSLLRAPRASPAVRAGFHLRLTIGMSYLQVNGHQAVLTGTLQDKSCEWQQSVHRSRLRPDKSCEWQQSVHRSRLRHDKSCEWPQAVGVNCNNTSDDSKCVKRRATANNKERRRTKSLNKGFEDLRNCLPEVPADTKLSKIKTLTLAISYIGHLQRLLEDANYAAESQTAFATWAARMEKQRMTGRHHPYLPPIGNVRHREQNTEESKVMETQKPSEMKKSSGRTGWPVVVWEKSVCESESVKGGNPFKNVIIKIGNQPNL